MYIYLYKLWCVYILYIIKIPLDLKINLHCSKFTIFTLMYLSLAILCCIKIIGANIILCLVIFGLRLRTRWVVQLETLRSHSFAISTLFNVPIAYNFNDLSFSTKRYFFVRFSNFMRSSELTCCDLKIQVDMYILTIKIPLDQNSELCQALWDKTTWVL
jgi:hypothetical protein